MRRRLIQVELLQAMMIMPLLHLTMEADITMEIQAALQVRKIIARLDGVKN